MCGFVGQISSKGPLRQTTAALSSREIRHRGPDDEGYLFASTATSRTLRAHGDDSSLCTGPHVDSVDVSEFDVELAFRRLAIVDLTTTGAQPMKSADSQCWIVFNGEIYNHVELAEELASLGHRFVGRSDTEVLLAAYQEWGRDCVHHLNGMWAFCILDLRQPEAPLFLSRDRFGEKPLFLAVTESSVFFASEIKALTLIPAVGFRPDEAAVARFLGNGSMPSPQHGETFLTNVSQLPPAHNAVIGKRGVRTWRYWDLPDVSQQISTPFSSAVEELRELLTDSIRLRLRADVPIGTCLSGGVDSSSIAVTMGKLLADAGQNGVSKQHTFTAAYDDPGRHDERPFVKLVLDVLDATPIYTFPTADGLISDLDALVAQQDEPFGSTSIYAQWCVMRAVRQTGVKVLLDGQGADELFAGYGPAPYRAADHLRRGSIAGAIRETSLGASSTRARVRRLAMAGAIAAGIEESASVLTARRQLGGGTRMLREPAPRADNRWQRTAQATRFDDHLRRLTLESSLPDLLRFEDRNAMAFSIESRTPFLDPRIAEFAFTRGADHRIAAGWSKYVLRAAMSDRVPEDVIWRRDKVGFETPSSVWRDLLRRTLRERLGTSPVNAMVDSSFASSDQMTDLELWRLLNVAVWWKS